MICLDPWLEPLASEDPTPVNNECRELTLQYLMYHARLTWAFLTPSATSPVSSLVINSEGFTLWDSHFERLQRILRGWNTTELLTLGALHTHIPDTHCPHYCRFLNSEISTHPLLRFQGLAARQDSRSDSIADDDM